MRYRDLKRERDEAIARAVEAERLSLKSEFDRLKTESEATLEEVKARAGTERAELVDRIEFLEGLLRECGRTAALAAKITPISCPACDRSPGGWCGMHSRWAPSPSTKFPGPDCERCHGSGRNGPDEWCPECKGQGTRAVG